MRNRTFILLGVLAVMFVAAQIFTAAQFEIENPAHNTLAQAEPTIDPFPQPTDYGLIVAEQVFENGRMFYIDIVKRIWVLYENEDGFGGTWEVYVDEWEEGDPEFDENINPPDGLHQPIRGFGVVWRENEGVRDALGWALDPEVGHVSQYNYYDRDLEDSSEEAADQPGWHTLVSYYGRLFVLDELEMTWEIFGAGDAEMSDGAEEESEDSGS